MKVFLMKFGYKKNYNFDTFIYFFFTDTTTQNKSDSSDWHCYRKGKWLWYNSRRRKQNWKTIAGNEKTTRKKFKGRNALEYYLLLLLYWISIIALSQEYITLVMYIYVELIFQKNSMHNLFFIWSWHQVKRDFL